MYLFRAINSIILNLCTICTKLLRVPQVVFMRRLNIAVYLDKGLPLQPWLVSALITYVNVAFSLRSLLQRLHRLFILRKYLVIIRHMVGSGLGNVCRNQRLSFQDVALLKLVWV